MSMKYMNYTILISNAIFIIFCLPFSHSIAAHHKKKKKKNDGNYKLTITVEELKSIMDPIVGLFPRRFL